MPIDFGGYTPWWLRQSAEETKLLFSEGFLLNTETFDYSHRADLCTLYTNIHFRNHLGSFNADKGSMESLFLMIIVIEIALTAQIWCHSVRHYQNQSSNITSCKGKGNVRTQGTWNGGKWGEVEMMKKGGRSAQAVNVAFEEAPPRASVIFRWNTSNWHERQGKRTTKWASLCIHI